MANLDDLKVAIASYLGRVPTDFVIGGSDLLLLAINNAKRWAQAQRDFEACRTQAKVTVSTDPTTGGNLSAVTLMDGTTPVNVKLIEAAYLMWNDQTLKPINFLDRKSQSSQLRQRLMGWPYRITLDSPPIDWSNSIGVEDTPNLVQQADFLFFWPQTNAAFSNEPTMVTALDVVQWLPDYTSTSNVVIASAVTSGYNDTYIAYGQANGRTLYIAAASGKIIFWVNNAWFITPLANLSPTVSPTLGYTLAAIPTNESPFLVPDGTYAALSGSTSGAPTATSGTTNVGSDWFLVNGFEFLMFKSIVDGNYLWEKFAQAQEGFLASPTALAASAWQNLVWLDGERVGQNSTAVDLA